MNAAVIMLAVEEASPHTVRWAMLTLVTILLLFLLFVVCVILVRTMRRHRERLLRRRAVPTEYVDAWSMHKLPDDAGLDAGEDSEEGKR